MRANNRRIKTQLADIFRPVLHMSTSAENNSAVILMSGTVNPGIASNLEVLDGASELPTLLYKYVWIKNGDRVSQTVDYLTSIGIIALAGDRESIFSDYEKIRAMESKLVFL